MPERQHKKHFLRRAIVGLFKRSPIRKKHEISPTVNSQAKRPHSVEVGPHERPPYPDDDDPQADAPRGRPISRTPSRGRAPTPHPHASRSQNRDNKTVRWADALEQPTLGKREPATLKMEQAAERDSGRETGEKEEATEREEKEMTTKEEKEMTTKEDGPSDLRRNRRSSIPIPKRKASESDASKLNNPRPHSQTAVRARASTAPTQQAAQRPSSPLISQDVPAPLRSPRAKDSLRQARTVPNHKDAAKEKEKSIVVNFSRKREPSKLKSESKPQPILSNPSQSSRTNQPEVIALSPRASHHHRQSGFAEDKPLPHPTTSFLKVKPRRPTSSFTPKPKPAPSDSKLVSTMLPIPSSATAPSFYSAKSFWKKIDNNSSGNRGASMSMPVPKPETVTSAGSSASKTSRVPISSSGTCFHNTENFWAEMSDSTSCAAVVSGENSRSYNRSMGVCKTSKVSELEVSSYTVNEPSRAIKGGNKDETTDNASFRISLPFSHHIPKRQQGQSDINDNSSPFISTPASMKPSSSDIR
ncbi:hypothetical protein N0V85_009655, partial [Neurospora sp. IMI 360204]